MLQRMKTLWGIQLLRYRGRRGRSSLTQQRNYPTPTACMVRFVRGASLCFSVKLGIQLLQKITRTLVVARKHGHYSSIKVSRQFSFFINKFIIAFLDHANIIFKYIFENCESTLNFIVLYLF